MMLLELGATSRDPHLEINLSRSNLEIHLSRSNLEIHISAARGLPLRDFISLDCAPHPVAPMLLS